MRRCSHVQSLRLELTSSPKLRGTKKQHSLQLGQFGPIVLPSCCPLAQSSIKPKCHRNPHDFPFSEQMRRQASARPHRSRLTAGLEKGAKCGRFASHQHASALATAFRKSVALSLLPRFLSARLDLRSLPFADAHLPRHKEATSMQNNESTDAYFTICARCIYVQSTSFLDAKQTLASSFRDVPASQRGWLSCEFSEAEGKDPVAGKAPVSL